VAYHFIILQPAENWIAAERIRFKPIAALHVPQKSII
jgi:hypothetical protein